MAFLDTAATMISSIAEGISKAGLGNDAKELVTYAEDKVKNALKASVSVSKFNTSRLTALEDITMEADKGRNVAARVIKKGQAINARNQEELLDLYKFHKDKIDFNYSTVTNEKTKGALQENYKDFTNFLQSDAVETDAVFMKGIGRAGKETIGVWNGLKGYYGDEKFGGTRLGLTIAGTSGTMIGLRYLQGGNLTTKANGERDIAGVPFI